MAHFCLVDVKQESFNRNSKITNSVIARVESGLYTRWRQKFKSEIMSKHRVKTEYQTLGAYGSTEKHVLYAEHNNSCDVVSFYDGNGDCLFSVEDTMPNNLFDAIKRLYSPFKEDGKLIEGVEFYTDKL